MFNFL
jgi:hypothetical protein